jgi:hypothetical protein
MGLKHLRGNAEGSFAEDTIKRRMPSILSKIRMHLEEESVGNPVLKEA